MRRQVRRSFAGRVGLRKGTRRIWGPREIDKTGKFEGGSGLCGLQQPVARWDGGQARVLLLPHTSISGVPDSSGRCARCGRGLCASLGLPLLQSLAELLDAAPSICTSEGDLALRGQGGWNCPWRPATQRFGWLPSAISPVGSGESTASGTLAEGLLHFSGHWRSLKQEGWHRGPHCGEQ